MCGIIGAVSQRDIAKILLEGLRSLEYRGYDSSGLMVVNSTGQASRLRCVGKVNNLACAAEHATLSGETGIAHTRWATHGKPAESNAHPHISTNIAVVHNGIIENHELLRDQLQGRGYTFYSETDTEVVAHLVHWEQQRGGSLLSVVQRVIPDLRGTYGMVILDTDSPDRLIAARSGSPLVIGCGVGENFIVSDPMALLSVTRRFIYLEEGDVAQISCYGIKIIDRCNNIAQRCEVELDTHYDVVNKGVYSHYMQKEIYEQPSVLKNTLSGRHNNSFVELHELNEKAYSLLKKVEHIQIVACGTSYHSGMVARYWLESLAKMPCDTEIASEFRYRKSVVRENSLFVTLSQSGETADTLAALRLSKRLGYLGSLSICNVASSSLVRESDFSLMMKAGIEVGVASTKSFTAQLVILLILVAKISSLKDATSQVEREIVNALQILPSCIEKVLLQDQLIAQLAQDFSNKNHALFLGRGDQYPIAMEGALKLKEISYIHAEAYAAGELKHGPLALIDSDMPVIVVAPQNALLDKLKSNIEEIRARGGLLYIFTDAISSFVGSDNIYIVPLPHIPEVLAPIVYIVPLQLLSYYIALIRGTDLDKPRNLAKSVTVE
ncbi:Glutamine--fructose-6-phosphate aminotransferase[isomerizing] [Candidatus Erwinia haradaeae]|uniref:Glutamine--fructose-6-phosphate aminotransferase [isomerizing] n=1 Tax=Candidatus Erwinia haradaeae TaxID=1922217 RepID=A0A451DJB4_9GAMM|nr:glutamine--fructose-6-phosphate transaminase (isomerizing) [Candidatus Erwinia haradaeae]VFP86809.1 Glutamine--fructose-6-phosphate aminotransferase[isomerizing] [Candidatus Erwinia haradaeae]